MSAHKTGGEGEWFAGHRQHSVNVPLNLYPEAEPGANDRVTLQQKSIQPGGVSSSLPVPWISVARRFGEVVDSRTASSQDAGRIAG